ncbi:hemagglutinin repeat-containing protein, partial [Pasteurellaceae bacterium LIM206]|nr:hemagglutinin repeat-containing protein [Pasteurellaceae bacterium LIM206]
NVKLSLSVGASQSKRESHGQQISHNGSSLSAGNVSLSTTEGDLNVAGSNVTATNRLTLASARDINLTATQDSDTYNSSNNNSGWSAGVFVGYSGNSYGFGFEASGQVGKGKENSETTTQTNSRLNAAQVELTSANDTTLRGATVNATRLTADIGNNLTVESLQDTGHYDAKQTQTGAEVSIAYGSGGSGAVNFSQSKARMNYAQ